MSAKRKLLVIGLDGFDPLLLERFRPELPNLAALGEVTGPVAYSSVFPPDSVPAWVSFYTGLNPAEHGILEYVDYTTPGQPGGVDTSRFRERTFWDLASRAGKRVMVLNPFLAYPAWEVNGIMASGPAFVEGSRSVYPREFADSHPLPFLGGYTAFPGEGELACFLGEAERDTRELAACACRVWEEVQPDLGFVAFLTPDRIQHFLWRYTDQADPTYPGTNPFGSSILSFYRLVDEVVGSLRSCVGEEVQTLVMSDHGHGRRCARLINVNEILRKEGLLACRGALSGGRLLERVKNTVLGLAHRLHLEKLLQKAAKRLPNKEGLKHGDHVIDREHSLAWLDRFDGANPFAGIRIPGRGEGYEQLREQVIAMLTGLPGSVVKWAGRREAIYTGPYLARYPDVLFELDPAYGVSWSLFAPPVVPNPRQRTLSGGHRRDGVLLVSSREMAESLQPAENPMSLHRHVLEWMGL